MAPDYRGFLASDPNKSWALDYVGNDYNTQNAGINLNKLYSSYDPVELINRTNALRSYANQYANLVNSQNQGTAPQTTYDPYAAQRAEAAQQKVEEERKATELRGNITGTVGNLQSMYNQLYGDIGTAAQSQRGQLEKQYGKETSALGEQFTNEFPRIGQAWAGRGAYSSSYRARAEKGAQQQFAKQLEDIRQQKESKAADIGKFLAENQARVQGQQGYLTTVLGKLGETSLSDLQSLRNEIDKQIADVTTARAGQQSQEAYLQRFAQLAPVTDRLANLQATLSNIINGAAPGRIKQQVAEQIIGSAGLNPQEEETLRRDVLTQLGQ